MFLSVYLSGNTGVLKFARPNLSTRYAGAEVPGANARPVLGPTSGSLSTVRSQLQSLIVEAQKQTESILILKSEKPADNLPIEIFDIVKWFLV